MFYVLSVGLVALGVIVLVIVGVVVAGRLRRYLSAASMVSASTQDHVGLLRARSAAVKIAVAEKRRRVHPPGRTTQYDRS